MTPDDPRHGTVNGYNNLKCHCDRCREAHRDYFRARRRADGILPTPPRGTKARHATSYSYQILRCRCEDCRRYEALRRRRIRRAQGMQPRPASQKYREETA